MPRLVKLIQKIVKQNMESLIHHFKLYTEGVSVSRLVKLIQKRVKHNMESSNHHIKLYTEGVSVYTKEGQTKHGIFNSRV